MKKLFIAIISFTSITLISFSIFSFIALGQNNFEKLSPQEMYDQIIQERNLAIEKAKERGDYKCCISPPCTMCYMEGNKWNYNTPGTCACDEFIARGEDPCPQCKNKACEENS